MNRGERALVVPRPEGLYCPAGDFYIDPWRPVARAVLTHAHADHARTGHAHYLCSEEGAPIVRARLGEISLQAVRYGEPLRLGDALVSLHPAGHIRGSAQIRIEMAGEVWVVSGDYKLAHDPTCTAFEPVRCHTFVTESTFGLPIYRWPPPETILADILAWWSGNASAGRCSVLYCYALGKAQRILAGLQHLAPPQLARSSAQSPSPAAEPGSDASLPGPLLVHGAIDNLNRVYREAGVSLPQTEHASAVTDRASLARALVLAPPAASGTTWTRRFGDHAAAFASGWMQVRGARKQRGVERGFVLSDHADWPGLLEAVAATGAERVLVTHGRAEPLARFLAEKGLRTDTMRVEYGAEDAGVADGAPDATMPSE